MTIYCNLDKKYIRQKVRVTVNHNEIILKKEIMKEWLKYENNMKDKLKKNFNEDYEIRSHFNDIEIDELFDYLFWENENSMIARDLKNLSFETSNIECSLENNIIGITTLETGLPIVGLTTCGDGSVPFFICLYFDGKNLRAYVPQYGNTFNIDENSEFEPYHEIDDDEFFEEYPEEFVEDYREGDDYEIYVSLKNYVYLREQGVDISEDDELEPDYDAIIEDIENAIIIVNNQ